MHIQRGARLALATVMLFGMAAGAAVAQDSLRIGAINPYSGPLALYGDELARGYQLAVAERNAKGGVLGKKIELVRGDATNPQQGIAAVDQLVTREKVDLLIGTYISAVSNAASDAALKHQKLYWDTNAIAAELTERKLPNFVRSGPHGAYFAEMSVRAVLEIGKALGKQPKDITVWLEHEDSIYGKTIVEVQKKGLEQAGVKVVGVGSHNFRATDLTDVVLRAKKANPDIWMQTGYVPDGNLMLRTAREQALKPPAMLWVGTGDTFETLEALGPEYLEGLFVVSYPRPDINEKFGPGAAEPTWRRIGRLQPRAGRPAGHGRVHRHAHAARRGGRGGHDRHGEGARCRGREWTGRSARTRPASAPSSTNRSRTRARSRR